MGFGYESMMIFPNRLDVINHVMDIHGLCM